MHAALPCTLDHRARVNSMYKTLPRHLCKPQCMQYCCSVKAAKHRKWCAVYIAPLKQVKTHLNICVNTVRLFKNLRQTLDLGPTRRRTSSRGALSTPPRRRRASSHPLQYCTLRPRLSCRRLVLGWLRRYITRASTCSSSTRHPSPLAFMTR